jgi:hypothetical protein
MLISTRIVKSVLELGDVSTCVMKCFLGLGMLMSTCVVNAWSLSLVILVSPCVVKVVLELSDITQHRRVNVVLELSDVGQHLRCEGRSSTW